MKNLQHFHVTVTVRKNRKGKPEKVCFVCYGNHKTINDEVKRRFEGCEGLKVKVW